MSVTKKIILLGSGLLFFAAVAIYLYGAMANVTQEDRANLSSIAVIILIVNMLGSSFLLRFARDEGAE